MSLNINSNFAALSNNALAAMKSSQSLMGKAISHVSTGKRVNNAVDGAGAYVSAQIAKSNAAGYDALNTGVQNGSAYLKAADQAMTSIVDMLTAMNQKAIEYNSYTDKTDNGAVAAQNDFNSFLAAAKSALNLSIGTHENLLSEDQTFTFTTALVSNEQDEYASTGDANNAGLIAGDIGEMENAAVNKLMAAVKNGLVASEVKVGDSTQYLIFNGSGAEQPLVPYDVTDDDKKNSLVNDKTVSNDNKIAANVGFIVDEYRNARYRLEGGKIYEGTTKAANKIVGSYEVAATKVGTEYSVSITDIKWDSEYVNKITPASSGDVLKAGLFVDEQTLETSTNRTTLFQKTGIEVTDDDIDSYSVYINTDNTNEAKVNVAKREDNSNKEVTISKSTGAIVNSEGEVKYRIENGIVYGVDDSEAKDANSVYGYYSFDDSGSFKIKWRSDYINELNGVTSTNSTSTYTVSWNSISSALSGLDINNVSGITTAIKTISNEQAKIGGGLNALEYISSNLSNIASLQNEAYTTLTEADMAEEMTSYVKNNIYSQAAQAMIAQSNQSMAQVLNLLQ